MDKSLQLDVYSANVRTYSKFESSYSERLTLWISWGKKYQENICVFNFYYLLTVGMILIHEEVKLICKPYNTRLVLWGRLQHVMEVFPARNFKYRYPSALF